MAPNHGFLLTDASGEPVSRTYQYRKVMKPMLERKRRARINRCLDELKELMTGALQTEGENVAKLEKADILELTVRHLHNLRQHNPTNRTDQTYVDRFKAGFRHCASEVTHFLNVVDQNTSVHVLKHLNHCITQLDNMPQHQLLLHSPIIQSTSSSSPSSSSSSSPPSLSLSASTQHQILPAPGVTITQIQQQQTSNNQQSNVYYQSGIWTQKPIQSIMPDGHLNNNNSNNNRYNNIKIQQRFRTTSQSLDDQHNDDVIDIQDDCQDVNDNCETITYIHTPQHSPKINVVDDMPIWRPW